MGRTTPGKGRVNFSNSACAPRLGPDHIAVKFSAFSKADDRKNGASTGDQVAAARGKLGAFLTLIKECFAYGGQLETTKNALRTQ